MIEFAVHAPGMADGTGNWVLAVDAAGERLLLSRDDGSFYWASIVDCKLVRVLTPDQPRAVIPVQPQQVSQVIQAGGLPLDLKQMRRNGH